MATGLGPRKCKHFCSSTSDEVNGEIVAVTSTANMLHDWASTSRFLSTDEPLWPGELIATGTLPFGASLENGHWLKPGDLLSLAIEDVGEITHGLLAWAKRE
jgi:2-keto-4-pentenoate hydratase/2-oxohepta-3-ene-1,7-dioic acid hydratase in catechol pathway